MMRFSLDCVACRRIEPDRAERIIKAILSNMENWESRLCEIEEHATPITGNLGRALSLRRDMEMCRLSLERLAASLE